MTNNQNGNYSFLDMLNVFSVILQMIGYDKDQKQTSTPAAVDQYNNVSAGIYIDVPAGCCVNIAVENTSTQAINVANANLVVTREA